MGFRENVRAELSFSGISVRELSERTGISKRTLDNYLRRDNPSNPTAENAVKIAGVLGVTVEQLVLGEIPKRELKFDFAGPQSDVALAMKFANNVREETINDIASLTPSAQKALLGFIEVLKQWDSRAANGGER